MRPMYSPLFAFRHGNMWRQLKGRFGIFLLATLAFTAACSFSPSGGGGTTPTPTPTATPTPCASWSITSSPNLTQFQENDLFAVTAVSPTSAWAVGGSITDGLAEGSLIEQWDGTAWHIVSNPNNISFWSVVALSQNDAWVVGYNRTPRQAGRIILIQRWNGAQWSEVSNPNPTEPGHFLVALAAVSANDVWAVGNVFTTPDIDLPLTERWDGSAWKIVTNPALPGVTDSLLSAVTHIPASNQLWAVGFALKGSRPAYEQPLIERWDGAVWQVATAPTLPSGALGAKLHGVVALSATNAWAVGEYTASDHTIRALMIHWDGSAWKVITGPNTWGTLASVAAAGAHDVRAVGHTFAGDGSIEHLLVEQWNGTAWQVAATPEPVGSIASGLNSITTDGKGAYWAVGSYRNTAQVTQTLIAHCP